MIYLLVITLFVKMVEHAMSPHLPVTSVNAHPGSLALYVRTVSSQQHKLGFIDHLT